ncbi:MAG: glycerate kinase [Aldersonia sp.]|nr:glycerate kinase [Aldersonia sp.]
MRALNAPHKFTGTLTAAAVADRLADGMRAADVDTTVLPLADGGDGSVDAAVAAGFAPHPVTVSAALGTPHRARIAVDADTAVVEVANTCGLTTLPHGRKVALDASSLGLGHACAHALTTRPRRLVIALGGSASTDAGMGLLAGLGYTFRDHTGNPLPASGRSLARVAIVDATTARPLDGIEIVVASDVTNPLTGPNGAAAVYGPQKGADPATVRALDAGLNSFVDMFTHHGVPHARRLADTPGAGSAGGIGFAALLLGARLVSGADYFLDLLDFDHHLAGCDLVVTGEGSIDEQTEHGKLLTVLARRAHPTPVIAVAGRSTLPAARWPDAGLHRVHSLADYTDRNTATDPELTGRLLTHIGHQIATAPTAQPATAG